MTGAGGGGSLQLSNNNELISVRQKREAGSRLFLFIIKDASEQ
jgi:hypothetical protein